MLNDAFPYIPLAARLWGMKTNQLTITINTQSDTLALSSSNGVLLITSARWGIVCHCLKGNTPKDTLAAYIATLPADSQLDTLELVRSAARLVSPCHVSEKDTLTLYPNVCVRI